MGTTAQALVRKIRELLPALDPEPETDLDEPTDPDEPFAMVCAALKPRPHLNSGAIALALPESDEE
jgi:hypothetical protein